MARAVFAVAALGICASCARVEYRRIEVTGYCPCGECNGYERGFPDFWNNYISNGSRKGQPYTGKTAAGTRLHVRHPGLVSVDSLTRPYMIPVRVIFPWLWFPQKGTIAADTAYYPFGTEIWAPGYGWGVVEDRGGAIKGPERLDLFFRTHAQADEWGRQTIVVKVKRHN